ncbi:MAG: hypothetical protein LBT45_01840 [Rickettsiales bacterium]|nr:hypothetical protein [Rickettsiales bacterium]
MPTKKTVGKLSPEKQTANHGARTSVLKWFFIPDMEQGWGKWALRAGLFVLGCVAVMILFGAMGFRTQFASAGLPVPSLFAAIEKVMSELARAAGESPLRTILSLLVIYSIGMFIFMPRKFLDKTGFIAVTWTSSAWFFATFGAMLLADKYMNGSNLEIIPTILVLITSVACTAGIVCYARKHGVSKLATFLSFPFGFALHIYSGHFLPAKDKEQTLEIKYNWYRRLIDFGLNTRNGQMLLAFIFLAMFAINPSPWEAFLIVFFGGLYFWKGKTWMLANLPKLSWAAVAMNIAIIAVGIYLIPDLTSFITIGNA